ncbi:Protein very KIND [Cricetulus griseus]|uniref:Protein very KIND n=1 Tax=Cricetulus griseus TaxID=10029 RepID=G3IAM5_CRIGR|nr:Protein very KIND [Cricetulus griseus]
MQAMDPASRGFYEEDGKDLDFYDFEPLPTLPEDEENVSLADILSLRDRGLSEQEAWAVCLECSLSMRSVAHAAIFQTLCITPDTLAFNTSGNVCFMEQLSDDPEGAFVPPEFDLTGNTFEAHIYSLGATLKAALEYVAEPELEPRLSPDLEGLLSQMQAEDPRDRPDLESIIALCEEKMQPASSCRLCRSLSAIGRRVLSIESFGAFQDPSKLFLEGKNGLSGFKTQSKSRLWPEQEPEVPLDKVSGAGRNPHRSPGALGQLEASSPSQGPTEYKPLPHPVDPGDSDREGQIARSEEGIPEGSRQLESAATEQSLSLQDLLSKLGRPFREYELWALCLSCLSTLQKYTEHPARLCLDNVLVAEDGTVFFGPPLSNGPYNSLFLAPEVSEEKLGTEKASVYCVAAVLWTAAKFSVPQDHKLALPRRLKTLLLDMARRHASERPSAAEAIKVHPEEETIGLQNAFSVVELKPPMEPAPESSPGFLQVNSDTKLVAVPGPVPSLTPCHKEACELPAAFTSEATHFKPIVLAQDTGVARDQFALSSESNEKPKDGSSQLDREGMTKQASQELVEDTDLKVSDQLPPGLGLQGTTADPAGDSVPHSSTKGCSCPHGPSLATHQKGTSGTPTSSASSLPPEHRPDGQGPLGATLSSGSTSASQGPRHPCKPPRGKAAVSPSSPKGPEGHPEKPRPADRKLCPSSVDTSSPPKMTACPSLQEAMRLIQEEFAFDGYLDNGLEALIMGEYIYALKDLTFATFCGAISEKFCDLYWDEQLLKNLFKVVNGPASPSESTSEEPGSQPEHSPSRCSVSSKRPSLHGLGKEKPATTWGSGGPCSPTALSDIDSDTLSQGNFEVGFRSQKSIKATREQQPGAEVGGQPGPSQEPTSNASDTVAQLAKSEDSGPAVSPGAADFQNCSPGWSSAFYEADCFGADVYNYVKGLERQKANGHTELEAQSPELEQQLMIEKRNYRKTLKFYQKLLQKEKRNKGSEVRTMLSKLRGQLEEMKSKVMYAERWGLEPCALPVIVNIAAAPCDTLDFSPLDESSSLIFYNVNKHPCSSRQKKARILQAGTPLGLMAYLYSSDAFLEGYVQQFLYTFRYFCTPHDFLQFLLDRISSTLSRAHQDPTSTFTKIYRRSLCVLQAWVEDCYTVDFIRNAGLLGQLEDFISSKILPLDGTAKHLLGLLEVGIERRADSTSRGSDLEDPKEAEEDTRPFNALCKRFSEDGISRKSFSWRLPRANGLVLPHHKERQYTIASALPKPCFFEDFYGPYAKASEKGPYFLTEYSTNQLFTQLTLLQQLQVNLLSKFLLIAKSCYEQRNFATAMQILGGLEHLAVRQSPAWKILPAKIAEVMEELKAVEVFLKSDSLCLMEGRRFRAQPTLPSAHLLAMHIQQLETGGFTMTNGAHRWSKLRNIAKVASQVHAFQENPYTFSPDPKLQAHLKQRIARFSGADVSILAADNRANFHQIPSEKHSRKIQDKLRRMKATFQ